MSEQMSEQKLECAEQSSAVEGRTESQPPGVAEARAASDEGSRGVRPPKADGGPVGSPRQVYISLSSLLRGFDKQGDALLHDLPPNALFFFGSKRSWVFPEGRAEEQESRGENPKYTSSKYQKVRDLILAKEADNQVFFLKPPGFKYNGSLYHGHPEAFDLASRWLQSLEDPVTGQPYEPLKLDPEWWRTQFKAAEKKYTKSVEIIIKNFQHGAHDYAPVMELLWQSNPTLDIVQ